jgi:SAM-dependent methyltransferase
VPEGRDGEGAWAQLRASYDHTAGTYQARFLDELETKERDRELLRAFARRVTDPVADIGCGPGQVGAFVRLQGRRVLGVDLSSRMAALAGARLDGALVADLRRLPFASGQLGGVLAFYSLIHVRRFELAGSLAEFHRVLRPGGLALFSAHEGQGLVEVEEFLGERVPFVATLYDLDELVTATREAGFAVTLAERRAPYPPEHPTFRLYVQAERSSRAGWKP